MKTNKLIDEAIIAFSGKTFSNNEDVIIWLKEALTKAYQQGQKDMVDAFAKIIGEDESVEYIEETAPFIHASRNAKNELRAELRQLLKERKGI